MKRGQHRITRALAIEPHNRGFGYAVLELADDILIDWGGRQANADVIKRSIPKVAGLIHRFAPSIVIVEDTRHPRCRRSGNGRALIESIADLARTMDVAVGRVSRLSVRKHYAALGAGNKDAVAKFLVKRFPELRRVLPPPRKLWMARDERMTIFDSIAFATIFECKRSAKASKATHRNGSAGIR